MDAMYTENFEDDHLVGCCDDAGVTFDPSGELAPPLPPVDVDVQPDASFDVIPPGQPGSTDVSYDVAPEFTPDVTAIPTPDAPPPAPLAEAPADDCGPPPAPFGSVEGEGSFDVTGLGQPGSTDGSIDVIGLGQPGNTDVAPDASIDVIGLGQPGNPVIDAPTVGFVGGSAPLEMTIVPGDGSTQVDEQSAGLGVISGGPDDPLAAVLANADKPVDAVTLAVLMESQRTMNEIWTSDNSSSS